ncbi:C-GCAxxG-C-C family protein [Cellulosilyticum ruminicola]|uniref:C-GCAxxG-C-C family protein n=1 Tax=Cellulosilyticum ruminicola TaxID=425254 RepID=UPI0006D0ABE4|nr:C-GCAxxG-C-C family protein [Cellulosilyticum ruminicola]
MNKEITVTYAAEEAVDYKHEGHNCAQAVIHGLSKLYDMDAVALEKIAAGFGVGMGTMGATCGALIGANMVMGECTGGQKTMMKSKQLFSKFEQSSGATICKELKGIESGRVLYSCDDCVRNAVIAAASILE